MKIAYTHDWLCKPAGAEVVISVMEDILKAPVYTLFYTKKCIYDIGIDKNLVHSSFLQYIPTISKTYKNFLPLYPLAIENLDLSDYDLVISSSHSVAKGFKKRKGQIHVCYCHTPMRYIWDMYDNYKNDMPSYKKIPFSLSANLLRKWDYDNSKNVDIFIANSRFVAARIKRIYKRESKVIYPPVNTDTFKPQKQKEDYYLFVGRLINSYKKVDLVVEAFNKLNKKLIVVGDGDDTDYLKSIAKSNIEFAGWLKPDDISKIMGKAKALILPSIEDFGIVSVEAQACGTPVIAFRDGGALETVLENKTGIFFNNQAPDDIVNAVHKFEAQQVNFNTNLISQNAQNFSKEKFQKEFKKLLFASAGIEL